MIRPFLLGSLALALTIAGALVDGRPALAGPSPATCYVDAAIGNDGNACDTPANPKRTIQAGVDAVATRGLVVVAAGEYTESVFVGRPMRLSGARSGAPAAGRIGSHCFVGPGTDPDSVVQLIDRTIATNAFTVTARDVVIDGFCVQNAAVGLKTPEGVPLNVILRSTFVEQSGMGFDVGNCRNCEFSEDVFIYLGSASGAVRNRVGQSSSLLIRNSYFWFMTNSTALLLDAEPASAAPRHHGATIRESSFFGVKAAVVLNQVGGAKILHNDIFATGSGIELQNVFGVAIRNNIIQADDLAGHGVGVSIAPDGLPAGAVTLHQNSLSAPESGVRIGSGYTGNLDLKRNWWGSATGPSPASLNPASDGGGAAIQVAGSAVISFSRWYCTGASSTPPSPPGFDPTGTLCP